MEDLRPVQADAQRPVAKGGVLFLRHIEIGNLLVRADIQRPDNHFPSAHIGQHFLIGLKLDVLRREIVAVQVQEFTAEQAHAAGVVREHRGHVVRSADVAEHLNALPVL